MAGAYPVSTFNLVSALQKISPSARKPLILAQGTSAGSFTSGALVSEVANGLTAGNDLCGAGSIGALMINAFKQVAPNIKLAAIIVSDNGSGVAAAGSIAITASSPAAGTFYLTVGSYTKNRYAITTTTSSTATTIGDDIAAAVNADENSPVTAINTTGTVAFTAKNKGTEGNNIGLKVESLPSGVTSSLTAFTSGATDPSLTGILTKIDASRYDIICPVAFLSTVNTHLLAKFNVSNAILDGVGFVCKTATYANAQTALAANTLASKVITYLNNKLVNDSDWKGGSELELDYVIATYVAAIRALRFKANASISAYMQSPNNRGGAFLAGIPYHNMKLVDLAILPPEKAFTLTEIQGLADLGGSTLSTDESGTVTVTNPLWMTVYKAETPTADGFTYKNLNKSDCATTAREYIFRNLKNYYSQSGLTAGVDPNNPLIRIATERNIRAYIVGLWQDLTGPDYAVLQGSPALLTEFQENLIVNVDTATGSVSGSMAFNLMGQLETFDFDLTPNL